LKQLLLKFIIQIKVNTNLQHHNPIQSKINIIKIFFSFLSQILDAHETFILSIISFEFSLYLVLYYLILKVKIELIYTSTKIQ